MTLVADMNMLRPVATAVIIIGLLMHGTLVSAGASGEPINSVSVGFSSLSSLQPGAASEFSALVQGGSGSFEYQYFWRKSYGSWAPAGPYSSSATWLWDTTGFTAGTYYVQVYVRNSGSSAKYEMIRAVRVVLSAPASSVSLTMLSDGPQAPGIKISFAALGQGGSGSYEYRFAWRSSAGKLEYCNTLYCRQ